MKLTPVTAAMIREDMAKPGADLSRVCRQYQVPSLIVRQLLATPPPGPPPPEKYGGFGRPELEQYTVARTQAGKEWAVEDKFAIEQARLSYDAGTCEMCQGRDGDWLILYAIPRRIPVLRTHRYFIKTEGYFS